MNQWYSVWNNRSRPGHVDTLRTLIDMDGHDHGAGRISCDDWTHYVWQIARRLGLQTSDSVFDVGCGSGAFLHPYYLESHRVGGIDYSKPQIDLAREVMPAGDFAVGTASDLNVDVTYDFVISVSVFHYFDSLHYAEEVVRRMLKKARKAVALLDVPDRATQAESEAARRGTLAPGEYEARYHGLNHLYYERAWFAQVGEAHDCRPQVFDQCVRNYGNNGFRFNTILFKTT